ncbi:MAG: class I SAM-dependent methyltransferase [Roseiflexaceae bacterium]|nr:class I SAM-dependent methyltransferase [Roseiflexaceae bacterium]
MPDFATIYAQHAEQYDQLVSREDYQGNLLRAFRRIRQLPHLRVAELGAGTGRITRLLASWVRTIHACDGSAHMLAFARQRLSELAIGNVMLAVADNAALPLPNAYADLALAGWSFGHTTTWEPNRWQVRIGAAIGEMQRVLKPGGAAIIIETLGTGRTEPAPPDQALANYYRWLEQDLGWQHMWIRTDYRFHSQQEADDLTGFFFGSPAQTYPAPGGRVTVPECTGIWWRIS